MHKCHRIAFSIFAAVTISGCAVMYQEPTGSSVATIEFMNESAGMMSTHFHADAAECTGRSSAGGVQAKSQKKLVIPAGKSLAFTAGMDTKGAKAVLAFGVVGAAIGAKIYKGCTPTIDFVPEVGRTYVFSMSNDGSTCAYQFYVRPSVGSTAENVEFSEREWIRAMSESGPFCKKK